MGGVVRAIWRWLEIGSQPLHRQPALWITIAIPTLIVGFLGIFSVFDYSPDWSSGGVRFFLEITRPFVPWVALIVALAALVARIHTTVQTRHQIEITEARNAFSGFLDHRAFFQESVRKLKSRLIVRDRINEDRLYRRLFPRNGPQKFYPYAHLKGSESENNLLIWAKSVDMAFFRAIDHHSNDGAGGEWKFMADSIHGCLIDILGDAGFEASEYLKLCGGRNDEEMADWDTRRLSQLNLIMQQFRHLLRELAYISSVRASGVDLGSLRYINEIEKSGGMVSRELLDKWVSDHPETLKGRVIR